MAHIWPTPNAKLVMDQRRATAPYVVTITYAALKPCWYKLSFRRTSSEKLNVESHGEAWIGYRLVRMIALILTEHRMQTG